MCVADDHKHPSRVPTQFGKVATSVIWTLVSLSLSKSCMISICHSLKSGIFTQKAKSILFIKHISKQSSAQYENRSKQWIWEMCWNLSTAACVMIKAETVFFQIALLYLRTCKCTLYSSVFKDVRWCSQREDKDHRVSDYHLYKRGLCPSRAFIKFYTKASNTSMLRGDWTVFRSIVCGLKRFGHQLFCQDTSFVPLKRCQSLFSIGKTFLTHSSTPFCYPSVYSECELHAQFVVVFREGQSRPTGILFYFLTR